MEIHGSNFTRHHQVTKTWEFLRGFSESWKCPKIGTRPKSIKGTRSCPSWTTKPRTARIGGKTLDILVIPAEVRWFKYVFVGGPNTFLSRCLNVKGYNYNFPYMGDFLSDPVLLWTKGCKRNSDGWRDHEQCVRYFSRKTWWRLTCYNRPLSMIICTKKCTYTCYISWWYLTLANI